MLSDSERRRFNQIAAQLRQDDDLAKLESNNRRKAPRSQSRRARRRSLLEWAEQHFDQRTRRDLVD